jgi:hypothetical protein
MPGPETQLRPDALAAGQNIAPNHIIDRRQTLGGEEAREQFVQMRLDLLELIAREQLQSIT